MRMRMILGAALAAAAMALPGGAAQAQSVPPGTPWNGFYVGAHVSGNWADSDVSGSAGFNFNTLYRDHVNSVLPGSLSDTGFGGGVQGGMNWRSGNVVLGLEADIGYTGVNAERRSSQAAPFNSASGIYQQVQADFLFTLRPRLGYVFGPAFVYGTVGLAVTTMTFNTNLFLAVDPANHAASASRTMAAPAFGGGVEVRVARNITVGAQYLYMDFGSVSTRTFSTRFPNQFTDQSANLTISQGRLFVNWQF